jgi:DDE superfamily endonuclease
MTPFNNPRSPAEERFNVSQRRTRSTVERCIGVLKSRFRCVFKTLDYSPRKVCNIFVAVCVLHNMCIDFGDEVEVDADVAAQHIADQEDMEVRDDSLGAATRAQIVQHHFS